MLSFSSLRRIAHSISLRATGSLMVLRMSAASEDLPLRAAVTACLSAASSSGGSGDAMAAADGPVEALAALAPFSPLAVADLFLSVALLPVVFLSVPSLDFAAVPALPLASALSLVDAVPAFGWAAAAGVFSFGAPGAD